MGGYVHFPHYAILFTGKTNPLAVAVHMGGLPKDLPIL
jgi:hypothetical protein